MKQDEIINKAISYIFDNLDEKLTVDDVADYYGYSSSNFATAFKNHLDYSPEDFRKHSQRLVHEAAESHGLSPLVRAYQ